MKPSPEDRQTRATVAPPGPRRHRLRRLLTAVPRRSTLFGVALLLGVGTLLIGLDLGIETRSQAASEPIDNTSLVVSVSNSSHASQLRHNAIVHRQG